MAHAAIRRRLPWLLLALLLSVLSNVLLCTWARSLAAVELEVMSFPPWQEPTEARGIAFTGQLTLEPLPRGQITGECGVGWPLPAITWTSPHAIAADLIDGRWRAAQSTAPTRINPLGVAADLFAHAALWLGLLYAATGLRRGLRRPRWEVASLTVLALVSAVPLVYLSSWWVLRPFTAWGAQAPLPQQAPPDPGPLGEVLGPSHEYRGEVWPCRRFHYWTDHEIRLQRTLGGWPAVALAQDRRRDGQAGYPVYSDAWTSGLAAPAFLRSRFGTDMRLALRPVWPGFAINLIFYAIVIALVVSGARHALSDARVLLRRRRGRCVTCGYDLSDLEVCPECGSTRATGWSH